MMIKCRIKKNLKKQALLEILTFPRTSKLTWTNCNKLTKWKPCLRINHIRFRMKLCWIPIMLTIDFRKLRRIRKTGRRKLMHLRVICSQFQESSRLMHRRRMLQPVWFTSKRKVLNPRMIIRTLESMTRLRASLWGEWWTSAKAC